MTSSSGVVMGLRVRWVPGVDEDPVYPEEVAVIPVNVQVKSCDLGEIGDVEGAAHEHGGVISPHVIQNGAANAVSVVEPVFHEESSNPVSLQASTGAEASAVPLRYCHVAFLGRSRSG